MTGLFTNTAGAPAAARGWRRGGAGPRVGAGDPGGEPGRSGASGAGAGGVNPETRWPRLSQLSSRGLGRSGWGARVGVAGVFCPRCRWVSAGDTGSGGAALGVPPRLPPFARLAALKTPRSAWPAAGRGNRSRVPAWPLPGASPAPLPKRWARVHSCPTESGSLSSAYLSGSGSGGAPRTSHCFRCTLPGR